MNIRSVVEYIRCRTQMDLRSEGSKSYLGYGWWVFEPCLMMAVFYLVFGILFQRGGDGFASSLLVGITSWLWFASSIQRSLMCISREKQIMAQLYVPKIVFPIVSLLTVFAKQLIVFFLLLLLLSFFDGFQLSWIYFPLIVLAQLLLIAGVSFVLSALTPFFPDVKFIVTPLLQMGMFCSGVFYSVSSLPTEYQQWILLNPMANLIEQYRVILLSGNAPDIVQLSWVGCTGLICLVLGVCLLLRFDRHYPRVVI